MKLAWICYLHEGWEQERPILLFEEPEYWLYDRVIPIVYAEIVK